MTDERKVVKRASCYVERARRSEKELLEEKERESGSINLRELDSAS